MTFKWSLETKIYCVYSSLHIRLKNGMQSLKGYMEKIKYNVAQFC